MISTSQPDARGRDARSLSWIKPTIDPASVQKLHSIDALDGLQRVRKAVAAQRVKADHFNLDVFKP
jgi:hypothetical protein